MGKNTKAAIFTKKLKILRDLPRCEWTNIARTERQ